MQKIPDIEIFWDKDTKMWIGQCPITDIISQDSTKERAYIAMLEAIGLWTRDCIARGILIKQNKEQ